MSSETFSKWCLRVTGEAFATDIAKTIGIPASTISGWMRRNDPSFKGIYRISKFYNANPLIAFVELGLVEEEYLSEAELVVDLVSVSSEKMLSEVLDRERQRKAEEKAKEKLIKYVNSLDSSLKDNEIKKLFYDQDDEKDAEEDVYDTL